MSRKGNFRHRKQIRGYQDLVGGSMGGFAYGTGEDDNVLQVGGDGCTTWNVMNATELYT